MSLYGLDVTPAELALSENSATPRLLDFLRWHLQCAGVSGSIGLRMAEHAVEVVEAVVVTGPWPAKSGDVNGTFALAAWNETFGLNLTKTEKMSRSAWNKAHGKSAADSDFDMEINNFVRPALFVEVRNAFKPGNLLAGKFCDCDYAYCRNKTLRAGTLEIVHHSILPNDGARVAFLNRRTTIAQYLMLIAAGELNLAERLEPLVRSFQYAGILGRRQGRFDDTLLIETA